jgi:hypothetical protein
VIPLSEGSLGAPIAIEIFGDRWSAEIPKEFARMLPECRGEMGVTREPKIKGQRGEVFMMWHQIKCARQPQ